MAGRSDYWQRQFKMTQIWAGRDIPEIHARFTKHALRCKKGCVAPSHFELTCFTGAVLYDAIWARQGASPHSSR